MAETALRPDIVLFDLDGTLVQSREAAWEPFAPIAARHGVDVTSAEEFRDLFSRNFSEGLRRVCSDDATFELVKAEYFEVLVADYRPPLVPGMREVVLHLAERTTLAVVSSNALRVVRRILEHNGIATCFAHVFTGDVNPSKEAVIRKLRANTGFTLGRHCAPHYDETGNSQSVSTSSIYLVTDTVGDVEEARRAGATAIGVAWGMHSVDDLRRAGADQVVLWPQELVAILGQGPVLGSCPVPAPAPGARATSRSAQGGGRGVDGCSCACADPECGEGRSESAKLLERVRAANARRAPVGTAMAGPEAGSSSPAPGSGAGIVPRDATPTRPARGTRSSVDPEVRSAVIVTSRRGGGPAL